MTVQLTKAGIEFDEFRVWRETTEVPPVTTWYITVGYRVTTAEGETWQRDATEKLKGVIETQARDLLAAVRSVILKREGLS
jgi:hypothetical protein